MCRYIHVPCSFSLPAKLQIQPPRNRDLGPKFPLSGHWALIKEGPTTSLVGGFTPDDCHPSRERKKKGCRVLELRSAQGGATLCKVCSKVRTAAPRYGVVCRGPGA